VTIVPDATPPLLTGVSPPDRSFRAEVGTVVAYFNEPMDVGSLEGNGFDVFSAGNDAKLGTEDDTFVVGLLRFAVRLGHCAPV